MSKELIISSNRHETKVAVLEDDQVVEVYFQRENEYSLAGSIHKGRVTRVLPGMQSAFVDIGLERDAFLYVSDFFEDNEEYDKIVTSVEEKVLRLDKGSAAAAAAASDTVAAARPAEAAEPAAQPEARPEREPRERDRRGGRRSRRRRPGGDKTPRVPESKFYRLVRGESEEAPPASAPREDRENREDRDREEKDFFVLPGESLAKYSRNDGNHEAAAETTEAEQANGNGTEQPEVVLSEESEVAAEMGVAAAENIDLPGAVPENGPETVVEEESEESAPAPEGEASREAEPERQAEEAQAEAEQAEEEEVSRPAAAEESEEENGPVLAAAAEVAVSAEDVEPAAPEDEAATESAEEEEKAEPEPARIITSLTATLREREQGPRYLQRMSRRMRRKGGRGGDASEYRTDNPAPQRTSSRPEHHRTAARPENGRDKAAAPSISDLLREGQEIIVQIAKEPLGQKGARITSHIALPGRFLVYMPTVDHIGVSRKIASDEERTRLKRVLQSHRAGIPGGFIVRTAGEGRPEQELRADMIFLYNLWLDMRQKAEKQPAPALIHHDLDVVERTLRDQLTPVFKNIWVDSEDVYEKTLRFVQRFQPALVGRVKLYTRPTPIFDEFSVTSELEKALRPKVWLKSGGYIVINQTEALVAIDVNTGKYVGKSNRLEDTIVKTNTDAIREIVRQIRLRDLGGIIVVDFIDMDERKNRQRVMQALEEAMRSDRAPYKILQFNDFGLVAITRKRVKQSLERTLCSPCPYCEGAGYVKSVATVISEILVEAQKIARAVEGEDVILRVNPEVAKVLKSAENNYLQELEEVLGRPVLVKGDPQLHQEKFDLA